VSLDVKKQVFPSRAEENQSSDLNIDEERSGRRIPSMNRFLSGSECYDGLGVTQNFLVFSDFIEFHYRRLLAFFLFRLRNRADSLTFSSKIYDRS
jgi:hypothetical protein